MKDKKIKIEIKHWLTGSVLFEYECVDNTMRKTVEEAVMSYADLRYANLSSADLSYANLRSANLSSADLRYADLSSADLRYANLSSANLSSADLSYANLRYADLSYADLRYANLSYADLSYANLSYANLSYADLRYADLSYADLRYANLSYADLSSADLRYANLSSANLRYAKGVDDGWLDYWWHVHHEVIAERLIEPVRRRIDFIKNEKPKGEIATRLRLLKPVLGKIPKTGKGWEALHKKECLECPWDYKQNTIFPKKK